MNTHTLYQQIEASAVTGASRKVLAAAADPAAGAPPLLGRTAKPRPAAAAPAAGASALGATGSPASLGKATRPAAAPQAASAAQGPPLPVDGGYCCLGRSAVAEELSALRELSALWETIKKCGAGSLTCQHGRWCKRAVTGSHPHSHVLCQRAAVHSAVQLRQRM